MTQTPSLVGVSQRLQSMSCSQILDRAAELIIERGWSCEQCRAVHVHADELDVYGAIMAALGWEGMFREKSFRGKDPRAITNRRRSLEAERLLEYLGRQATRAKQTYVRTMIYVTEIVGYGDLMIWNDEICSSPEEAHDALTQAAELARSRGE